MSNPLPDCFSYREPPHCDNLSPQKSQGPHGTCSVHALLTLMETKLRMREPTREGKLAIGPLSVERVLDKFASEIQNIEKDEVGDRIKQFIGDEGVVFEKDYACSGQNGVGEYSSERAEIFEDVLDGEDLDHVVAENVRCYSRSVFKGSFNEWLRRELFTNGPLIVAFRTREGFQELEKGQVLGPEFEYEKNGKNFVWHACLLVGWLNNGEDECFEIQNSYGAWADDGFGWLYADDVEEAYDWDVYVKGQ